MFTKGRQRHIEKEHTWEANKSPSDQEMLTEDGEVR